MASHVVTVNVIEKAQVVEQELFTEVAVRMGQDVSVSFVCAVTILNVSSQSFDMVQSLLSDKHSSSFQTNLAERLFMLSFHMSLQRGYVWELLG